MKDSRIMLALKKKLACKQNEAKVKRLVKGLEIATMNAEEKAAKAEDTLDKLIQGFNVETDIQSFIEGISKAMYQKDEAESAIEQLKRINDYLFEEMDIDDTPEEQK